MTKRTSYLLGIVLAIIVGSFLYQKYCCNCNCSNSDSIANPDNSSANNGNPFKINGNGFDYHCNDNFKFGKDGFKMILPASDSIELGLSKLKSFLEKEPNQKLLITGYANPSEKNTSAYPNLGLARANEIKNYFVSRGYPASKFELHGEIQNDLAIRNDTLNGPADYKIITSFKSAPKDWTAFKSRISANPLILYFNTGQTEIKLSAEERQKVADLVNYLDNVEGSGLNVIGHTDNVGNRETNTSIGLERANFAKGYLIKNGIDSTRIETSSKGPDEPIADNKTSEGKSKNRRTVITIK
ncbi:MAG: OmpA family protein [Flavobacterium sp.]